MNENPVPVASSAPMPPLEDGLYWREDPMGPRNGPLPTSNGALPILVVNGNAYSLIIGRPVAEASVGAVMGPLKRPLSW